MTTPLADIITRRIAQTGPITLADYMAECLLHPTHGYYTTRDPLGARGDFTTAPEVSQMFGELIGLALAEAWLAQGAPSPVTFAELGPGRGTLMADALRATKGVAGFHEAIRLHLVEASPTLRARQRAALESYDVTWCDRIEELPDAPLLLVANEFFDALPIRQFTRDAKGWRETQVGLKDGALTLGLSQPAPIAALDHRLSDTRAGDIVETCPASLPIMSDISRRITAHGGTALIIDYGGWHSLGDTFQALEAHEMVDPLARPGAADLTAHVDFEALAQVAKGMGAATGYMEQREMLWHFGIEQRASSLATGKDDAEAAVIEAAFLRLTSETEMGTLFKALAISATPQTLPLGFRPTS
ncbi:class I SAM-dependent methyltransferase [Celeribacter sp.]|uniref:class I SAM-dependent methyltransferase n=1 Tax=Celeribacter sp. TaxID=1890673 RepID=UPI003A95AE97